MINTTLYWLAAALILLFFELSSPGHFLFLSFSVGALSGALASWLGYSVFMQSIVATVMTGASFFILVAWIKKQALIFSKKEYQSNIFALVGKVGFITKQVTNDEFGQVKIGGETWACKAAHDEWLKVGTEVRIMRIRGAHAVVEKVNV